MKKRLLCLLLAGCGHGQIHAENDLFAWLSKNNDKNYTHGTKFSYYEDSPGQRETYSLGQSIYTPAFKKAEATPYQLKTSRPYAGWLYAEYRKSNAEDNVKSVTGFQVGCSGPCSYAKQSQVTVHTLLGQGYPTWDKNYSLRSEPGFIFEKEKYYGIVDRHIRACRFTSDIFYRIKLGNIIDSISSGGSFKYGIGLDSFDTEPVTFKAIKDKHPWSYYIFGDIESRFVGYNHLLQGSLFQKEKHTVDENPFVAEGNLGFRVRYENFRFSYTYTFISNEWEGQNEPFFFGNLDISW